MCAFLLRDYIKGPLLGEHSEHLYARYTHFRDFENALLPYMMECCQIISILHHEKPPIIHRDIKPQNIMISTEGKVKVMDFGIARAASSNTVSSDVMGSVHYSSPEQARNGVCRRKKRYLFSGYCYV